MGVMRRSVIATIAAAAALTAGCSSSTAENVQAAPAASDALAAAQADDVDVTADLTAAGAGQPWAALITAATRTEPGRVEVETTIIDPRGGTTGSPEAQQARAVCEGALAWLQTRGAAEPKVSVMESNGTSFVLYGHPSYPGGCTEV